MSNFKSNVKKMVSPMLMVYEWNSLCCFTKRIIIKLNFVIIYFECQHHGQVVTVNGADQLKQRINYLLVHGVLG